MEVSFMHRWIFTYKSHEHVITCIYIYLQITFRSEKFMLQNILLISLKYGGIIPSRLGGKIYLKLVLECFPQEINQNVDLKGFQLCCSAVDLI